MKRHKSALAVFAMLGSASIFAAHAANQIDVDATAGRVTRTRVVKTADLDLAGAAGQARLDQRIKVAAHEVCDVWSEQGGRPAPDYAACVGKAIADGHAQAVGRTAVIVIRGRS